MNKFNVGDTVVLPNGDMAEIEEVRLADNHYKAFSSAIQYSFWIDGDDISDFGGTPICVPEAPIKDIQAVVAAIKSIDKTVYIDKIILDDDRVQVMIGILGTSNDRTPQHGGKATFTLRFQTQLIEPTCEIEHATSTLEQLVLYGKVFKLLKDNIEVFEVGV